MRSVALGRARDAHAGLSSLYLAVGMLDAAEHHSRAVLAGEDRGRDGDTLIAMAHQALAGVFGSNDEFGGASEIARDILLVAGFVIGLVNRGAF